MNPLQQITDDIEAVRAASAPVPEAFGGRRPAVQAGSLSSEFEAMSSSSLAATMDASIRLTRDLKSLETLLKRECARRGLTIVADDERPEP